MQIIFVIGEKPAALTVLTGTVNLTMMVWIKIYFNGGYFQE